MNNGVQLRIGHVPWRYASGRIHVPGLKLTHGAPWELRTESRRWPLTHVRPEEGPKDPVEFARFAIRAGDRGLPLVLAPYIRRDVRDALEGLGVSYLDFYGNLHLVAPGVLVHVKTPVEEQESRGLGPAGRRAAQYMLEHADRAWAVTELARETQVSGGLAQLVMKIVEENDLAYTEGRGPRKRRRIREPARFLDWLVSQEPSRGPRGQLECSIYARTPDDLLRRLGNAIGTSTLHAVTGTAAAAWLGAGPSSVPSTIVRVDPSAALRDVALRAGAEPATRGANLLLWSDEGRVATMFPRRERDVAIAPNVRIYLDALKEQRGEDIASLFREQILGY